MSIYQHYRKGDVVESGDDDVQLQDKAIQEEQMPMLKMARCLTLLPKEDATCLKASETLVKATGRVPLGGRLLDFDA